MGCISRQLIDRLRDATFLKQASQAQALGKLPDDVKDAEECVRMGLDPVHSIYVLAQNITSCFAEHVSMLDEFEPYCDQVLAAQEEYLPSGPPVSPVTVSYFTTWAFYDLQFGKDHETIGTCMLDVSEEFKVGREMAEVVRVFQDTRMGIYEHGGFQGPHCILIELLTGKKNLCHVPSKYQGRKGELWYVRICPPIQRPQEFGDYGAVVTTPYVLLNASRNDWTAYLNKSLLGTPQGNTSKGLHAFLKHGRTPTEWMEFILQSYHHHQSEAIFLAGLPDVKGSMPHAD